MPYKKYKPYSAAKKGKKKFLKIRFKEIRPMSKSGYNRWSRKRRSKIWKEINMPTDEFFDNKAVLMPVMHLRNREAIKEMAEGMLWEGQFYMHGYSHGNTPTGCKLTKALVKITIIEKSDGRNEALIEMLGKGRPRLSRWWFWGKTPEQIESEKIK